MLQDLFIPFITIVLAEFGDKTQLIILGLASKTKRYFRLILGIILAFIIADGLAVVLGDFITKIIPIDYIKIGAGIIFIIFGLIVLMKNKEKESKCDIKTPFVSGFTLLFISEMGDKTQIAAALFATRFNPFLVLIGVVAALTALSLMAIYLGKFIATKIDKRKISVIAGILFIVIGILSFF